MKINPVYNQMAISVYKTQHAKSSANEYLQLADRLSLSEEVVSFSSTISKIKEMMDIRTPEELAHIEEIARMIRNGSYYVASDKVAAKIVDDYLSIN